VGAKDAKAWHVGAGVMCFFTLMWITGAILLAIGLTEELQNNKFDPSTDFIPVNGGCKVISVSHMADQRQDKNPYCVDVYTYKFTKLSTNVSYTSAPEEKQHAKGTNCGSSQQLAASYAVDQQLPCWELAAGKSKSDVDSFYGCGNGDCIKILDPSKEHAGKASQATLFIALGSIFLGVGLPACGIIGLFVHRCRKGDLQEN
jgi:hypothetical protein